MLLLLSIACARTIELLQQQQQQLQQSPNTNNISVLAESVARNMSVRT